MSTEKSIYDQHAEHQRWNEQLNFFADELKIMTDRLGEVASKYTDEAVLAEVEHFQNQLIIQKNSLDELKHTVKEHEAELEKEVDSNPVAVDHRKVEDHAGAREAVESFEKVVKELREEFNQFAAKWM